ncbi:VOC family protein [Pseudonocardia sp. KRD-184]|uniref:VOC family protein n=1 Tax=Pseudonocardia oceani TaxID=2792013 RepID=A0ABS6UIH2_9PSEU|nr:VOC family protein [Pseudonocardia oceani]MBW0090728.1 VOC family protein [Pseudonocardia oceani]MBW0096837.1 VOC family protein [Pseudonocardia oceani]MBW0109472.1 VOC family protein [Pseudonocardia oceani]MBW0123642.1 VOC family protein [Pseudonocardia oceani]MBW0132051.1 VOC family protein [Pseudonocardia oceani]
MEKVQIAARMDAIGIIVSDMAATLAFYRRLGVTVPDEAGGVPHVEADLGGGMRLMFDSEDVARSLDPGWTPPTGGGRVGLAFRLPDPASVDALHADMVAAGHHSGLEPFDAPWGQRYASLQDPDGTGVDLYAPS